MKSITTLLAALFAATAPQAVGADEAQERLLGDLVQVEEGRFVYDNVSICQLNLRAQAESSSSAAMPKHPART